MEELFRQNKIRFAQEFVNTKFSHGEMTVAETLFALIYRLIEPNCLPAVRIFVYERKLWCIDTRRLMIINELIRREEWDLVVKIPMIFISKDDDEHAGQFNDFLQNRCPSLKRKKIDGLSIKVMDKYGSMCCYDGKKNRFRMDLDQHIAQDHLGMSLDFIKSLTDYQCNICHRLTQICCEKYRTKRTKSYAVDSQCGCVTNPLYPLDEPWYKTSLKDLCDALLVYPNLCSNAQIEHQ